MSELKILMLLEEDSNKGYYISCVQVSKYEVQACINDQAVPNQKSYGWGLHRSPIKKQAFLYLKIKFLVRILKRG